MKQSKTTTAPAVIILSLTQPKAACGVRPQEGRAGRAGWSLGRCHGCRGLLWPAAARPRPPAKRVKTPQNHLKKPTCPRPLFCVWMRMACAQGLVAFATQNFKIKPFFFP